MSAFPVRILFLLVAGLVGILPVHAQLNVFSDLGVPDEDGAVLVDLLGTPGEPFMLAFMTESGPVPLQVGVVPESGAVTVDLTHLRQLF